MDDVQLISAVNTKDNTLNYLTFLTRAEQISQFIEESIDRKCEDLMIFSVLYHCKENLFGFQTKKQLNIFYWALLCYIIIYICH